MNLKLIIDFPLFSTIPKHGYSEHSKDLRKSVASILKNTSDKRGIGPFASDKDFGTILNAFFKKTIYIKIHWKIIFNCLHILVVLGT